MDKKRILSAMTVVGYGMIAIFLILAIVIGIMLSINGFGKPEKKVNNIIFSMPDNSQGITTENNTTSIATTDLKQTINFTIAGAAGVNMVDYSTREITVVINNSSTDFTPAKKDDTCVWFAQVGADGQPLEDADHNYIPVESNKINVKVNDPIVLILATTQYPDDDLNPDKDALYLKGGISHIHARSGDLLLEAQELKVQVDVPVENFEIVVYGYDYNDTTGEKVDLTDSVQKTAGISYKNIKDVENEGDEFLNISDTTQDYLGRTMHFVGESTSKYIQGKYYTVVAGDNQTIKWEENTSLRYFIKGTELELGVKAFPRNSTAAVLGSFKKAMFSLDRVSTDSAIILEGTNLLSIVGSDDDTTGSLRVVATLPILLGGNQRVEADIIIETAAYEIEKLEITNNQVKDNTISCLLNKQISIGFNKNAQGDEDINLGINIIPKFYNGHNNPYENDFTSIYAELKTNHANVSNPISGVISVSELKENFVEPISGITTIVSRDGDKITNKVSTFTANRMLLKDERVYLIVSDQASFSDAKRPYVLFNVAPTINKPETNQQNAELNELEYKTEISVSFAKEDAKYIELSGKSYAEETLINGDKITVDVRLSNQKKDELMITYLKETERPIIYPTNNQILYTKWVFFTEKSGDEFPTGVVMLSETGQIRTPTTYGYEAYPIGQGNVDIYPKLVLCDKNGNPFNCFYETFTVNNSTGYLLAENISSADIKEENKNNYVVIFDPHISEKIVVTENLTDLTLFYDAALTDKVEGDVEIVENVSKTFYLIGNSQTALANSKQQGKKLQATLKMSGDKQYNLTITYLKDSYNYNYASVEVAGRPKDDDCSMEFKQNENLIASINPQIKAVDIQSIDAVFDVVMELKLPLFEKDNQRRVLYTGSNTTIKNTDGENLNVVNNKYYMVKEKIVDEKTIYYWDEDYEYTSIKYEDGIKKITLKEELDDFNNIKFSTENLTLPTSVYYTLTIKQAHGNENADVMAVKTCDYKVYALSNSTNVITKDDISDLTEASYVKAKVCDDSLKLALYDGWKNEVNGLQGKYLYLVYTLSVGQVLKAVDSYRIDFNFTSLDTTMSGKDSVTIDDTVVGVNKIYVLKDESKDYETDIIKLNTSDGKSLEDVRILFRLTNNKTSPATSGDYSLSGTTLTAVLFGAGNNNLDRDYSVYVTVLISSSGVMTVQTTSEAYKFIQDMQENPMSQNLDYKITFYSFMEVENSNACLAVNIPLTLGFNVANNT